MTEGQEAGKRKGSRGANAELRKVFRGAACIACDQRTSCRGRSTTEFATGGNRRPQLLARRPAGCSTGGATREPEAHVDPAPLRAARGGMEVAGILAPGPTA
jgi:hypothetical protein